MDETRVTPEQVEREHRAEVHRGIQAAYILGVVGFGIAGMLVFILWLGSVA